MKENTSFILFAIFMSMLAICCSSIRPPEKLQWWKEVNNTMDYYLNDYTQVLNKSNLNEFSINWSNRFSDTRHQANLINENHLKANKSSLINLNNLILPRKFNRLVRKVKKIIKNHNEGENDNNSKQVAKFTTEWQSLYSTESNTDSPLKQNYEHNSNPIVVKDTFKKNHSGSINKTNTQNNLEQLISSKVKWDDDNEMFPVIARALDEPSLKTKIDNHESIYEKYANIMPLPVPATKSSLSEQVTHSLPNKNEYMSNNKKENNQNHLPTSRHSIVKPLSSSNNFLNFKNKINHSVLPVKVNGSNKRIKQNNETFQLNKPMHEMYLDSIKKINNQVSNSRSNLIKTVDFKNKISHDIDPNSLIAKMLNNNPFAIPISKKIYKVSKKASLTSNPISSTAFTKRINILPSTKSSSIEKFKSNIETNAKHQLFKPSSAFNLQDLPIRYETLTSSKPDFNYGKRVSSENGIHSQVKANLDTQLSNLNQFTPQKKLYKKIEKLNYRNLDQDINDDYETSTEEEINEDFNENLNKNLNKNENFKSQELSTEKENQNENLSQNIDENLDENLDDNLNDNLDENLDDEIELVNENLNNNFNNQASRLNGEGKINYDKNSNQKVKSSLNPVQTLPVQIINWRQAITHRKRTNDKNHISDKLIESDKQADNSKQNKSPFLEDRKKSTPKIIKKKPSPKPFDKQSRLIPTTIKPITTYRTTLATTRNTDNLNEKLIKTTKNSITTTISPDFNSKNSKQSHANNSKQNTKNLIIFTRKNDAYIAPRTSKFSQIPLQKLVDKKLDVRDNFSKRRINIDTLRRTNKNLAKNQNLEKGSLKLIEDYLLNENSLTTEATKSIPKTSFKCSVLGYFADLETDCEVFHICQENNRKDSFFCPPGTSFNQQLLVCDWKNNIICENSNVLGKKESNENEETEDEQK